MSRAIIVAAVAGIATIAAFTTLRVPQVNAEPIAITVYKTSTCGCCGDWIDHLEENGFAAEVHDLQDLTPVKIAAGLKPELASCHTAIVGDYAIEGHVPATDIKRLLQEKPDARGLAVPGMPMGSPGMEGPYRDSYDTLLYTRDGGTSVFQHHAGD